MVKNLISKNIKLEKEIKENKEKLNENKKK
jgi:hypothetical protein